MEETAERPIPRSALLDALEGHEILSTAFEGAVGIENGMIWQNGEVIVPEPTFEQLTILLKEALYC